MEERTIVPLIKEEGGGGGVVCIHASLSMHVVCILMGFRPKNEPNDLYGHPNNPVILLISI